MKMKKWLAALLLAVLVLCATTAALAAEAMDITDQCVFKASSISHKFSQLSDKKFSTYFETKKTANPWLEVTAPAGIPMQGLYICFAEMPASWEIQIANDDGDWFTSIPGDTRFLHTWVQLPEPAAQVRLMVTQEDKCALSINELYVLSTGDIPDWVQRWEPTKEKADILFLVMHPGDEQLFFGGAIPTYAAEQGRSVVVAYMSCPNIARQSEMLNGLWAMGVRNYPVWNTYRDKKSTGGVDGAYKDMGGKDKVIEWVTTLYRVYQPEVVVSHDVDGEDGHSQHKAAADAAQQALTAAATEGEYLDSYAAYGVWQVKKLYLHLYPEDQLTFDWTVPLKSLSGKTSIEAAADGYAQHVSLEKAKQSVEETGAAYDNSVFGLVYTTLGPDVRKDDFLENIYDSVGSFVEAPATPAPTPAPTAVPAYVAVMPQLNDKGYLDEGEFIYSSEEEGLWIYVSQTAKIIIERKYDATKPLTWFEAELWGDVESGELLHSTWDDPEKRDKVRQDDRLLLADAAKKYKAVFAMNTDYFSYRSGSKGTVGVIIREGEVIYDDPHTTADTVSLFPNLDTLALYPDGSMTVHHSYEMTAQDFLDAGAYTVYAFGPYLIKDGQIAERVFSKSGSDQPRCAFGMIEPGHYVYILCEGRLKRSKGVDLEFLAKLMRNKGCQVAFNMDGGQTAVFSFMGKQINRIGEYDGKESIDVPRKAAENLVFATSDQVGVYEVQ